VRHERRDLDGRRGVCPRIALAHVAAELTQPLRLLLGLDAFGDDRDPEPMGQ
jgi:hypothetical protein